MFSVKPLRSHLVIC